MGEAPENKDSVSLAPSAWEARRNLTAASLVWPELRVERLRVLRELWLHCGWGRNVAAASTSFWLPSFWLPSWPMWRNTFLSPTQHTHTAQRCLRVRHHLPRFPDVQVNVQKQSVPPETADSENNWSKILPSYFKYLQSYGHQNAYLASLLVSHKQHGFQSETHSLITDRALGAS